MKSFEEYIEYQESLGKFAKKDDYLKVEDGESVEGVFHGGILPYYSVYRDPTRYEQKPDKSAAYRVASTFVTLPDFKPKAFQMGARVWNQVKKLRKEHGPDAVLRVNRSGSTKENTVYFIQFVRPMTEDEKAQVEAVDAFKFTYTNLESKQVQKGPDQSPETNINPPPVGEEADYGLS